MKYIKIKQGENKMATTTKQNKSDFALKESEKYKIKGLKTMQGTDSMIVNCNLYYGGKKIAEVSDDGNGGPLRIGFSGYKKRTNSMEEFLPLAEDRFKRFIEIYPEIEVDISEDWMREIYPNGLEKLNMEGFIGRLIDRELITKDLKKDLRKQILYVNKKGDLMYYQYKIKHAITQKHIEHFKTMEEVEGKRQVVSILNDLPFDEALELYKTHD